MAQTHPLTSDNGKKFVLHQQFAEQPQATFFFSRPYSAWESGADENMNGLLRQYFPKKKNFKSGAHDQITSASNISTIVLVKPLLLEHLLRCFLRYHLFHS